MADGNELLRDYAENGSQESFAAFVRLHMDRVYSAALRRAGGNAHSAEDIAQTVFCVAARDARKLWRHPMLTAWLYTTTRYAAASLARSEQRRRRREESQGDFVSDSAAAPDAAWEDIAPWLDASIDGLKEKDRTAVLLRYFSGLTYAEIGARLNVSEEGARARVDRAVDRLRDRLRSKGVTSTAGCLGTVMTAHVVKGAPAGAASSASQAAFAQTLAVSGGATATGLGLATLIGSTPLLVGLSLVAVASGVYCVRQFAASSGDSGPAQRRTDVLLKEIAAVDSQIAADEDANARLQSRLSELAAENLRRRKARQQSREEADAAQQRLNQALDNSPSYWRLEGQRLRAEFSREDLRIATLLGLSPDERQRLDEVRVSNGIADERLQVHSLATGQTDDAKLAAERQKLGTQEREAVVAALGDAGAAKLEAFDRASGAVDLVDGMVLRTYGTDSPLSAAQGAALRSALEASSSDFTAGRNFDLGTIAWDQVYARTEGVLSPGQVTALRSLQSEVAARQKIEELMGAMRGR